MEANAFIEFVSDAITVIESSDSKLIGLSNTNVEPGNIGALYNILYSEPLDASWNVTVPVTDVPIIFARNIPCNTDVLPVDIYNTESVVVTSNPAFLNEFANIILFFIIYKKLTS